LLRLGRSQTKIIIQHPKCLALTASPKSLLVVFGSAPTPTRTFYLAIKTDAAVSSWARTPQKSLDPWGWGKRALPFGTHSTQL